MKTLKIRERALALMPLVLLLALFVLFSCAPRYPLGIPEVEWRGMDPAQRLQAHEKQAELDRAAAQRRAAEARAREEAAARRQAELVEQRRRAAYGERVQCVLDPAEARIFRGWRAVEPVALDLVSGIEIEVALRETAGRTVRSSATAYAAFDGQTVSICRDKEAGSRRSGPCLRLLGTFEEFRRGINKAVEAPDFLRGRLRCNLAPAADMPLRLIIER